jgi:hypothetical protein
MFFEKHSSLIFRVGYPSPVNMKYTPQNVVPTYRTTRRCHITEDHNINLPHSEKNLTVRFSSKLINGGRISIRC